MVMARGRARGEHGHVQIHRGFSRSLALLAFLAVALTALIPAAPVAAHSPRTGPCTPTNAAPPRSFPAFDAAFHTYAEVTDDIAATAQANPDIVSCFSLGHSYEGREIWALKVSDNVLADENEPEVMFDGGIHAREHMSVEMSLRILHWLVDGYRARDPRVTRIVNAREVWILPLVNPDGAEYDIEKAETPACQTGPSLSACYNYWRKNRQPNAGYTRSIDHGTDLNRNFAYRWDCCGGSSDDPVASKYHGPSPLSAPESRALRDFVNSRVIAGRQQIRTGISFHTSGRLVMWQYGYTKTDLPADMTADDHRTLTTMGRKMATWNGYTPQQGSDLYITDGSSTMWMYGAHRIIQFTFELTSGAYASDETIEHETGINREPVLYLLERAECPHRAAGLTHDCGPLFDDLEIARGWRVNPTGSDTATSGRWERGDPQQTYADGIKQLGTTPSGSSALVTGRLAGQYPATNDLDGGVTSVRSTPVAIPATGTHKLAFRSFVGHAATSGPKDYLRVRVIGSAGTKPVEYTEAGVPVDRDAVWTLRQLDLSAFAGQTVEIHVEAADLGYPSLFEAGVDDFRIVPSATTVPAS
jgi:hypothetical protein